MMDALFFAIIAALGGLSLGLIAVCSQLLGEKT
jgi:Na+-driven multidrug efflux pump